MADDRGVVYLVGAGPGDPGLLTLRGKELLEKAEVVVYDHLASPRLLDLAPATAERICAGKSIGHCTLNQSEINAVLVERARAGRIVVRLKGGDPLVFGRGAEEADHLRRAGIHHEIVPGVTAGVGVTAYAGIPVTHRHVSSAVAFVTGHTDPEAAAVDASSRRMDWKALAAFPGTLVVYMGVTHLAAICRTLIAQGKPSTTPAAVVESGCLPSQRTLSGTLASLPGIAEAAALEPPALLVVGGVVLLRETIAWFEKRPLFGQRILVTRPSDESASAAASLEALGAEAILAPMVEIRPIPDPSLLDAAVDRIREFDWLVFTSANGVRHFMNRLESRGLDLRALGRLQLAAIGPTTARALAAYHLRADLVPESFRSEGLVVALREPVRGQKVLLARADRGRTLLLDELSSMSDVQQVAVYRNADVETIPPSVLRRIEAGTIDWITLTSSAITSRLHALLPDHARQRIGREIRLASLSPVTTATARNLGWSVAVEADVYNWEGLVRALVDHIETERNKLQSDDRESGHPRPAGGPEPRF
jgi:uroporphyrinogen III methyltransferase/synthase